MGKPLHFWLPKWAIAAVKGKKCKKCEHHHESKDIVAITIREVKSKYCFCIEQSCSSCDHRMTTTFDKKEETLEKMCYFILEQIKRRKIAEKSNKFRSSKEGTITDAEANKLINFIRNVSSHEDMLREMGIIPKEFNVDKDKG